MIFSQLPVYQQKDRILEALKNNQVIVIQSPTGSGKTTQIPIILYEAGYSQNGIIAVTQPRRIAAVCVSEFIAKQLDITYPGLVGYKMRFEDKTNFETRIKIMTDGILLQEMKLDPYLSKYSVVMVDEAHERSLNIDFVLGLLKRVLDFRKDFKVIVSSATMNTQKFSQYFYNCPIINIDTITYPVTLIYDTVTNGKPTTSTTIGVEAILSKIKDILFRIISSNDEGDVLIFLPGEYMIKTCITYLLKTQFSSKLHLIPLYSRLSKEEQEKVFDKAPSGKKKVVIATNIAETSVTISGITFVIDSGLAKISFYNSKTYTSSLNETPVSKASCNQRKGRAGRTAPGVCYRLYSRDDFNKRDEYTLEEIYRTDLSEVVLRMAELLITDFETFDFISPPSHEGLLGAVDTLNMLKALNNDNTLSAIGNMMAKFPLLPRISRIIVESMMTCPNVLEDVLILSAFLSAQNPFIIPQGAETDARKAHYKFRDDNGDFVSYVKLYHTYISTKNKTKFCEKSYLDTRIMAEIDNIKLQLEEIVNKLGFPIMTGGSINDFLFCIASGMLQFICIYENKDLYRSLTADHVQIHPASCMFHERPMYIIAGEIIRTSRMFASTVSPLTKDLLKRIDTTLETKLNNLLKKPIQKDKKTKKEQTINPKTIIIANKTFDITNIKGKRYLIASASKLIPAIKAEKRDNLLNIAKGIKITINYKKNRRLFSGEKIETIFKAIDTIDLLSINLNLHIKKTVLDINKKDTMPILLNYLSHTLDIAKINYKELGFITFAYVDNFCYKFQINKHLITAATLSITTLEKFIDEAGNILDSSSKNLTNNLYRKLLTILS